MPLTLDRQMPIGQREVYHVKSGALIVGMIYERERSDNAARWSWSLQSLPNIPGVESGGVVNSLDQAKISLRVAWEAWLAAVGAKESEAPEA